MEKVYDLKLTPQELETVLGALEYVAGKLSQNGGDEDKATSSAETKTRLLLEYAEADAARDKAYDAYKKAAVCVEFKEVHEGPLPWETDE